MEDSVVYEAIGMLLLARAAAAAAVRLAQITSLAAMVVMEEPMAVEEEQEVVRTEAPRPTSVVSVVLVLSSLSTALGLLRRCRRLLSLPLRRRRGQCLPTGRI